MKMIVSVVYLLVSLSTTWALVPVEGLLMGEAREEYQQDPLKLIFSGIYDRSAVGESKKLKLYQKNYLGGIHLKESCQHYNPASYTSSWMEKQAKRSMVAALQYVGLDATIKVIGAYAKKLEVSPEGYKTLTSNIVKNYCSQNVTVFSLRNIQKSLEYYYQNPLPDIIPNVSSSPYASSLFKTTSENEKSLSNGFDFALKNFRAFCSWGGDVTDYRMLVPYLNNPFLMYFVMTNLSGHQDIYDQRRSVVETVKSDAAITIGCRDLICRKVTPTEFRLDFPRSIGSTGISTDLTKLYCHHFRFQDYTGSSAIPQVKSWIKAIDVEDSILETNYFISLMSGVPDATLGVDKYTDIPAVAKSGIDERWEKWSREVIGIFSKNLFYEESLKIRAEPRRDKVALRTEGFWLNFTVTLGELDLITDPKDNLGLSFDLKISKNYLRDIRHKWNNLTNDINNEGMVGLKRDMSSYIGLQLKAKERLFLQKMWNEDFATLIAQELLEQAIRYQGPLFNSYRDQVLDIPVKFSYGTFALSYLRYRADVKSGRLKLNL